MDILDKNAVQNNSQMEQKKLKFISVVFSVAISFLLVYAFTRAATSTTLGANISTNGNLSVSGTTTFNSIPYGWPSADGSSGQFLSTNGAGVLSWATASGATGAFVGTTTSSYDGNVTSGADTGYKAANAICAAQYTGSHLCQTHEILNTIVVGSISAFSGTAWIAEGPPGYLANSNDCVGFTSNDVSYLGAFWEFLSTNGGRGWLVNCGQTKPLACCE